MPWNTPWRQPKESDVNKNESVQNDAPEDVIVLGIASVETHGVMDGNTEILGAFPHSGIAEE